MWEVITFHYFLYVSKRNGTIPIVGHFAIGHRE